MTLKLLIGVIALILGAIIMQHGYDQNNMSIMIAGFVLFLLVIVFIQTSYETFSWISGVAVFMLSIYIVYLGIIYQQNWKAIVGSVGILYSVFKFLAYTLRRNALKAAEEVARAKLAYEDKMAELGEIEDTIGG